MNKHRAGFFNDPLWHLKQKHATEWGGEKITAAD
ncbi:hypothetical protein predicted by Glimmer/Critica [Salmonella enterica subsp. enterica serovar Weltevreden str. 2007-60-3289-1]|nr:hypothetical protein predicted by Glimmer/Critica [Salmonella enterica subsp. enterica serovar Weltevreden str. 2007-60-3289-1]